MTFQVEHKSHFIFSISCAVISMEAILMSCDNLSAFAVLSSNDMAGHVLQPTPRASPDLKVQVTRKQRRRHLRINKIPILHSDIRKKSHTHISCISKRQMME